MAKPKTVTNEEIWNHFRKTSKDSQTTKQYVLVRSCKSKRAIATKEIANRILNKINQETLEKCHVYHCQFCSFYHIGH